MPLSPSGAAGRRTFSRGGFQVVFQIFLLQEPLLLDEFIFLDEAFLDFDVRNNALGLIERPLGV